MAFKNMIKPKTTITAPAGADKPVIAPAPKKEEGVVKPAIGLGIKKPSLGLPAKPAVATDTKTETPKLTPKIGIKKPVVEIAKQEIPEAVKIEVKEEAVNVIEEIQEAVNAPKEKEKAAEPEAPVAEETTEEVVVEETADGPVVEATETSVKETTETASETPKEEKKKPARKSTSKSKAASTESVAGKEAFLTDKEFEILEAEMNLVAFDEEFEERKEYLVELANSIVISSDMTTAQVLEALAQLDELNREAWVEYFQYKTKFTNLTAIKPEGKIERIKRTNRVGGKNEADRERNGITACQNYEAFDGTQVNLMTYQEVLRYRHYFFQSIFEYINTKRQMLITVQACLKTESNL